MNEKELAVESAKKEALVSYLCGNDERITRDEIAGFKSGFEAGYDAGRPQWVAVADRLPEENGIYAVVIPHGGDETTVTYDAYHAKHGTWTHYRGHIAWMPIPPFESGKEQG